MLELTNRDAGFRFLFLNRASVDCQMPLIGMTVVIKTWASCSLLQCLRWSFSTKQRQVFTSWLSVNNNDLSHTCTCILKSGKQFECVSQLERIKKTEIAFAEVSAPPPSCCVSHSVFFSIKRRVSVWICYAVEVWIGFDSLCMNTIVKFNAFLSITEAFRKRASPVECYWNWGISAPVAH